MSFLQEYLLIFRKQLESFSSFSPPQEWNTGHRGNVLLLPGFSEAWVFLRTIANLLNSLGYKVHVIDTLERNLDTFEHATGSVKEYIDTHKLSNITLLSHSKGGIIAKILLDDPNYTQKITQSITIAVPYGGTHWSKLKVLNLHEHHPESASMKKTFQSQKNNHKILNLYPKIDHHVIPNKNLILEGAKNIQIDVAGHTRILEAEETLEVIKDHLL